MENNSNTNISSVSPDDLLEPEIPLPMQIPQDVKDIASQLPPMNPPPPPLPHPIPIITIQLIQLFLMMIWMISLFNYVCIFVE